MRTTLLILTIGLLATFGCQNSKSSHSDNEIRDSLTTSIKLVDNSFKGLQEEINHYKSFYNLGDTLTSSIALGTTMDTIYLTKFKLIDTTFSQYRPRNLLGYDCRFVGQYQYKDFLLILTHSITTLAGDGSPVLILNVFSDKGILIDQLETGLQFIHDPEIQPETRFSISKTFQIDVRQIEREFTLDKDKGGYVLVRTKSDIKKYKINDLGHFELI